MQSAMSSVLRQSCNKSFFLMIIIQAEHLLPIAMPSVAFQEAALELLSL